MSVRSSSSSSNGVSSADSTAAFSVTLSFLSRRDSDPRRRAPLSSLHLVSQRYVRDVYRDGPSHSCSPAHERGGGFQPVRSDTTKTATHCWFLCERGDRWRVARGWARPARYP